MDSRWVLDLPMDWTWRIKERPASTVTRRFWPELGGGGGLTEMRKLGKAQSATVAGHHCAMHETCLLCVPYDGSCGRSSFPKRRLWMSCHYRGRFSCSARSSLSPEQSSHSLDSLLSVLLHCASQTSAVPLEEASCGREVLDF